MTLKLVLVSGGHIGTFNIIKALSKKFELYPLSFLVNQNIIDREPIRKYCKDRKSIGEEAYKTIVSHYSWASNCVLLILRQHLFFQVLSTDILNIITFNILLWSQ